MPYSFKSEEMLRIVRLIESLRDNAHSKKDKIKNDFPDWDTKHDARITIFSKFINVTNSTQLALTFTGQHLIDGEWWLNTAKKDIPNEDKSIYANEFLNFSKLGFVQFLFSSTESGFRLFLKAIDPNACNNGTDAVKSIYDSLLRSRLSNYPQNSVELLDLLRLIRNTIHNNGVYFHRSGNNEIVSYKGNNYNFVIGNAVDFVTWDFIISISNDLLELIDIVVRDPSISDIVALINDPFSRR